MQDTHQSKGHRLQRIRVVLSPVAEQEQALEHLLRGEVGGGGGGREKEVSRVHPQHSQDDAH